MDPVLTKLNETLYSDNIYYERPRSKDLPGNREATQYLEASFAANVPSFPLSDPFVQAYNYKGTIYLAIQHLMQAMAGVSVGLERKTDTKKGTIAQGGAQYTDQGYEPFSDHPLVNILNQPNPANTFSDFVCQCILNWNLHGRVLIWGRPNNVGAPVRFYCLPVPLCQPAFNVGGNMDYPLGAWRIQQYYPNTGIAGILSNGLIGSAGALIDSREVYEMKNPHPVYTWAPYSTLVGGDSQLDNIQNIDLSFWSIMSQGVKPAGFIDAPGANAQEIAAIQAKIDNAHGGVRKHGRPVILGGGDPDRPGMKWSPFGNLVGESLHEAGWEIYTSFVLALFGLDMAGVGIRRSGGYAERWAARRDERDTLMNFLLKLSATLTQGGLVKQWGLLKKGVRVIINLPEMVGYEPAEMSRDMASDGTGTYNEVRHLRGMKGAAGVMEEFGNMPVSLAIQLAQKKLGIDDMSQQKELAQQSADIQSKQAEQEAALSPSPQENPNSGRPSPSGNESGGAGSLGGEGNGPASVKAKDALGHGSEKRGQRVKKIEAGHYTIKHSNGEVHHIVRAEVYGGKMGWHIAIQRPGEGSYGHPYEAAGTLEEAINLASERKETKAMDSPPQGTLTEVVQRVLSEPLLIEGNNGS